MAEFKIGQKILCQAFYGLTNDPIWMLGCISNKDGDYYKVVIWKNFKIWALETALKSWRGEYDKLPISRTMRGYYFSDKLLCTN